MGTLCKFIFTNSGLQPFIDTQFFLNGGGGLCFLFLLTAISLGHGFLSLNEPLRDNCSFRTLLTDTSVSWMTFSQAPVRFNITKGYIHSQRLNLMTPESTNFRSSYDPNCKAQETNCIFWQFLQSHRAWDTRDFVKDACCLLFSSSHIGPTATQQKRRYAPLQKALIKCNTKANYTILLGFSSVSSSHSILNWCSRDIL